MKPLAILVSVLLAAIPSSPAQNIFSTPDPSMDEAIRHLKSKVKEYCTFNAPGAKAVSQEWNVLDYKDGILTVAGKIQNPIIGGQWSRLGITYQIPLGKISPQVTEFSDYNIYTVVLATADGSEGIAVSNHQENHDPKGTQISDSQGHSVKFAIECHSEQQAGELKRAFSKVITLYNAKPAGIGNQ
jgi:hypothetical protein